MSEATFQLVLNGMVYNEYGIEDSIQVVSAIFSFLSIYKALAERNSFIKNKKDLGIFSWEFLKSLAEYVIPMWNLMQIVLVAISTSRDWALEATFPMFAFVWLHPIGFAPFTFTVYLVHKCSNHFKARTLALYSKLCKVPFLVIMHIITLPSTMTLYVIFKVSFWVTF